MPLYGSVSFFVIRKSRKDAEKSHVILKSNAQHSTFVCDTLGSVVWFGDVWAREHIKQTLHSQEDEGVYGTKHCAYASGDAPIDAPYVCGNSKQQTQTWHHYWNMWTTKRKYGKKLLLGSNSIEKNLNLTNHVMRRPRTLNNKVVYHYWNPPTSYVTNRFPLNCQSFCCLSIGIEGQVVPLLSWCVHASIHNDNLNPTNPIFCLLMLLSCL